MRKIETVHYEEGDLYLTFSTICSTLRPLILRISKRALVSNPYDSQRVPLPPMSALLLWCDNTILKTSKKSFQVLGTYFDDEGYKVQLEDLTKQKGTKNLPLITLYRVADAILSQRLAIVSHASQVSFESTVSFDENSEEKETFNLYYNL